MVKRYCQTLDQDYTRNKITVCAHLDHILNLFNNQRKPYMRTMADGLNIERQKSIQGLDYLPSNKSTFHKRNTNFANQLLTFKSSFNESKQDYSNLKIGVMDPNSSNLVPCGLDYYKNQSEGIVYHKEEKQSDLMYNSYCDKPETTVRPIRRLYINFDKDIAHKMFGYRIRFMEDYMKLYSQLGYPSVYADQSHKPIHYYAEEMSQVCNEKYKRI